MNSSAPETSRSADIAIYHNPACSNSRGALKLLRDAGIAPRVIEYLKSPPDKAQLRDLLARGRLSARDIIREKEALYRELKLDDPATGEDALLDAIAAHPVLLQRPLVVTTNEVRVCRPPEQVLDLLRR
jgi:arsenate reductase